MPAYHNSVVALSNTPISSIDTPLLHTPQSEFCYGIPQLNVSRIVRLIGRDKVGVRADLAHGLESDKSYGARGTLLPTSLSPVLV